MENVVLKMHFKGACVDVKVDDTDRCLLIDVINDFVDEAEKRGVTLPKNPSFKYCYEMRYISLIDDNTLLEMFTRLGGKKTIDIWIGFDVKPSTVLLMARKVREQSTEGGVYATNLVEECVREKLPIRRKPSLTSKTPPNVEGNVVDEIQLHDLNVPNESNVVEINPSENNPNEPVAMLTSPRRSRRLSQNSEVSKGTQTSQKQSNEPKFKMAKTSAKRKGVYVPKNQKPSAESEVVGNSRVTRGMRVQYDEVEGSSDSEGSYLPSGDDTCEEEEDDLADLDDEDNVILSSLDYIDDGYDPYAQQDLTGDDGGYISQALANGELYDDKEFGSIRLRPWQLFLDKQHFKDVLRDFCVQEGFYVIVHKADHKRYTADCATVNCQWRIHASVLPDGITWAIKSITKPDHGCAGVRTRNPMANCVWVAKKLTEDIRANPDIPAQSLQNLLMDRYGIQMAGSSVYKMKDLALKEINGGHDESYKLLPRYCEMIKVTNPGSIAICSWKEMENPERTIQFKSLFVSFTAQFEGLIKGCRSLIGVDGAHLKGNYGGVLLSAVALDENNELFPVAVSVVECENKDNWSMFFWHFKHALKDSGREDWTVISDRQKGVEPALDSTWPECYRRFCARHLCKNFKTEYPGVLMHKLFWSVVNATSEFSFKKALETIVQHGGNGCRKWFLDLGENGQWTKHKFDPRISSDENTSNFVESFNSTLGVHRCNPVLSLLEGVRRIAMVRYATRQHAAETWNEDGICPNIMTRLKVLTKDSRPCQAYFSGMGEYEVHDGLSRLPVSLNSRTCACGLWQVSGIPCKHAIRAILFANKNPSDYVSEWFSVRRYKEAYSLTIKPIPDEEQWQVFDHLPTIVPPTLKRSIGKPPRNRRREPGEQRKGKRSITVKCKKCGCLGHNSKTCKGGYTAREKNEQQGKTNRRRSKQLLNESSADIFESLEDLEAGIMAITQEDQQASTVEGSGRPTPASQGTFVQSSAVHGSGSGKKRSAGQSKKANKKNKN